MLKSYNKTSDVHHFRAALCVFVRSKAGTLTTSSCESLRFEEAVYYVQYMYRTEIHTYNVHV